MGWATGVYQLFVRRMCNIFLHLFTIPSRVHTFLWRQRKVCKRKPPGKKASFFPVGAAMGLQYYCSAGLIGSDGFYFFNFCGGYGGMSGGRLWHLLARGLLVRNNDKGEK